jgi:hypothetical protein
MRISSGWVSVELKTTVATSNKNGSLTGSLNEAGRPNWPVQEPHVPRPSGVWYCEMAISDSHSRDPPQLQAAPRFTPKKEHFLSRSNRPFRASVAITRSIRQLTVVTQDGSTLVTNAALCKPPIVISLTTIFATPNCGRWNPPLRRTTIPSCGRTMQPTRLSTMRF